MTLAELIAELDRRAHEQRVLSVEVLKQPELDSDTAVQASMQHDLVAEAYEAAAELARDVMQ